MTEGFKDKYPRTGPYREYRDAVEDRVERVEKSLMPSETGKEEYSRADIEDMFGLPKGGYDALDPRERQDVWNFVRYGTKRLAAAAVQSPMARDELRRGRVEGAFLALAPTGLASHDLIHAMVAYGRSNGASMVPAYLRVNTKEEQLTDATAIQEEMTVELIDMGGSNFVRELLKGTSMRTLPAYALNREFLELTKDFESLREKDPLEYSMRIYEAYWLSGQMGAVMSDEDRAKVAEAFGQIQTNRNPEYLRIFAEKYEDARSGHPDPKLGFKTFERIMAPLLERLRDNPEAE